MKYSLVVLFVFIVCVGVCQSDTEPKYIIVTLERKRNSDNHGIEHAYWIFSADSLNKVATSLAPLYLYGFSTFNFRQCCHDGLIEIFYYTDSTSYKFENSYNEMSAALIALIKTKRIKVQTINKRWDKGIREQINVYVTPVKGKFCYCRIDNEGARKVSYNGNILMPQKEITYLDDFWNSSKSRIIIDTFDFSSLKFLSLQSIM